MMLYMDATQMQVFENAIKHRFEEEMFEHCYETNRNFCNTLTAQQLKTVIQKAIVRADRYGFKKRGAIRLFIDMIFVLGSQFDIDPQYHEFSKILNSNNEQMYLADRLYDKYVEYLEKVTGIDREYDYRVFKLLISKLHELALTERVNHETNKLILLEDLNQQKVNFLGTENLLQLIQDSDYESQKIGLNNSKTISVFLLIRFALGMGCFTDPLYPWLADIFKDISIDDNDSNITQLTTKITSWLEEIKIAPKFSGLS